VRLCRSTNDVLPDRDALETKRHQYRVVEAPVLVDPDLLFFQAAMEAFDVAVAFRVVVGGSAMLDAEPVEGYDIAGSPPRLPRRVRIRSSPGTLSPAAAGPIATCRVADGVIIVEETAPYEDESLAPNRCCSHSFFSFPFSCPHLQGNAVPVKVASARGQNESRFPISEHMWSSR